MRELTADMFVSLDGFAAGADGGQSWTFGYFGPQFAAYAQQILAEPQIMIMGRVTYEIMARSWPSSPGPLAGPMNSLPKLVFSATLAEPLAWNNAKLARHEPVEEIRAHPYGGPGRRAGQAVSPRRARPGTARDFSDCGATTLVALKSQGLDPNAVGAVAVTHLHGDHFGGLPFLTRTP